MAEGEIPSLIIMGSKYKKKLEREWDGKLLTAMQMKTLQRQADENISGICRGKYKRRYK